MNGTPTRRVLSWRSRWVGYPWAVALTLLTLCGRLWIGDGLEGPALILFIIPILISAYIWGLGAGMIATTASYLGASYYLLAPFKSFHVADPAIRWQLFTLVLVGAVISFICQALRRSHWRLAFQLSEVERAREELNVSLKETGELRIALDAHAIVAVTDTRGRIIFVNDKFCEIFKYSREELLGQDHRIINSGYHPKEFIRDLWATISHGRVWHGEIRNKAKGGDCFWVDTTIVPLLNAQGKPRQYVAIRADITERKQAEDDLAAGNRELTRANEQLHALAARLENVREQERTRIAREIHDVLAQELTRLKIDLVWLAKRLSLPVEETMRPALAGRIADATVQTDTAITTVQRIATDLRPVILDSLGLPAAVEWQTEDFGRRTGITCTATAPQEESALHRDPATALFRILQESLTNIARHSGASAVDVRLTEADGDITLIVHDNGRGIFPAELADPRSIGLMGMRERADAFGGSVEIHGAPGAGTTVTVRLPIDCPASSQKS